jgi:hypothetical protein
MKYFRWSSRVSEPTSAALSFGSCYERSAPVYRYSAVLAPHTWAEVSAWRRPKSSDRAGDKQKAFSHLRLNRGTCMIANDWNSSQRITSTTRYRSPSLQGSKTYHGIPWARSTVRGRITKLWNEHKRYEADLLILLLLLALARASGQQVFCCRSPHAIPTSCISHLYRV